MTADQHTWLGAFRRGESSAFTQAYNDLFGYVCFFADKLLRNRPEAEEVASETLYKLFNRYDRFTTVGEIRSFCLVTARNHAYDILRSRNTHPQIVDEMPENLLDEHMVQNQMIRAEIFQLIMEEIKKLKGNRYEVIRLHYLEGCSLKEIADLLKIDVQTVRSTKRDAVARLRTLLAQKNISILSLWLAVSFARSKFF